jgi:hypothetical protein
VVGGVALHLSASIAAVEQDYHLARFDDLSGFGSHLCECRAASNPTYLQVMLCLKSSCWARRWRRCTCAVVIQRRRAEGDEGAARGGRWGGRAAAALCDEGGGGEAHDQSPGVTCGREH